MGRRTSRSNLRKQLKLISPWLDLDCNRPGRKTMCRVVMKDPTTGGEKYLSDHRMSVRETRYWVEGFVACKQKKFLMNLAKW